MIPGGGFTDLRLNAHGGQLEESFWPSFTDIMTMVVIIFLMALMVILLRNEDLVRRLQKTLAAEREASRVAQVTTAQKQALSARLDVAQAELSKLRSQLMQATEANARARQALDKSQAALSAAQTQSDQLNRRVDQLTAANAAAQKNLANTNQALAAAQTNNAELQAKNANSENLITQLRSAREKQAAELAAARTAYGDLKVKYDKLIRPARTAAGKVVVEVRYFMQDGSATIEIKRPGDAAYQTVNSARLNAMLGKLKQANPDKLYVKVVIPENSGLSYNEAWSFTTNLLERYDYYYQ